MKKSKKKQREDICCNRFYEAYLADEICYAYEKHTEVDETEWFVRGLWHLYFCPFCGASVRGRGFSENVPELENEKAPDMTSEEMALVSELSQKELEEIDNAIMKHTSHQWRKVAMIVGLTLMNLESRIVGIPDIFYSQRVQHLVKKGLLESAGDLSRMRFCEVRVAPKNKMVSAKREK